MYIPRDIADQILKHSLDAVPNEACGVLTGPVLACTRITNRSTVEGYFEMDPQEQTDVWVNAIEQGRTIDFVWHSHPTRDATPSPADIEMAWDPDVIYLICAPTREGSGQLRAWRIISGTATEISVTHEEETTA